MPPPVSPRSIAIKGFFQECSSLLNIQITVDPSISANQSTVHATTIIGRNNLSLISDAKGRYWVKHVVADLPEEVGNVELENLEMEEMIVTGTRKRKGAGSTEMTMPINSKSNSKKNKITPGPPTPTPRSGLNPERVTRSCSIAKALAGIVITPASVSALTAKNLATLDDDTESCSTVTFDNIIRRRLDSVPVSKKDREKMVQESETERKRIVKEDYSGAGGVLKRIPIDALTPDGSFKAPRLPKNLGRDKTGGTYRKRNSLANTECTDP